MYERLCANVKVNQAEILRFIGQLFIHWLYFIYALKFYSGIHVKITRRWKSTLTPFCYVCEGGSYAGVLVLGFERTRPITESAFRISFQSDWQIDNDFFNRPIMARTQIPVHKWRPRTRISALFRRRT